MTEPTIGAPQRRIDGRHKVTGRARYAADHPVKNLTYAYGVYSTIASGTELRAWSPEILAAMRKGADKLFAEQGEADPDYCRWRSR